MGGRGENIESKRERGSEREGERGSERERVQVFSPVPFSQSQMDSESEVTERQRCRRVTERERERERCRRVTERERERERCVISPLSLTASSCSARSASHKI